MIRRVFDNFDDFHEAIACAERLELSYVARDENGASVLGMPCKRWVIEIETENKEGAVE